MLLLIFLITLLLHGIILSFVVLLEQRRPSTTVAWMLTLLFLPLIGIILYYLFGRMRFNSRKRKRARALSHLDMELANMVVPTPATASQEQQAIASNRYDRENHSVIQLARRITQAPLSRHNAVTILDEAEDTFEAQARAIRAATHHVHVAYYILRDDDTGRWFCALLAERARAGVKVRLLVDGIGSYELPRQFVNTLEQAGVKFAFFLPLRFRNMMRRSYMNFRNHRKIVIVDGHIGFTGGFNVGDEYKGLDPTLGFWRDTHIRIEGPAVVHLQKVFAEDWCYVTNERLNQPQYYTSFPAANDSDKHTAQVQIIPSGPDLPWDTIHLAYFVAITTANRRVWITTPYFIPDDSILMALTSASLRGVDVRLLLPEQSDNRVVYYAGRSYYTALMRAGVKIYHYQRGMLHAKSMVLDGRCATIGSANLDVRSFQLNFELNAFVYGHAFAQAVERMFERDLKDAEEVHFSQYAQRPMRERLLEAGTRLLSPLL